MIRPIILAILATLTNFAADIYVDLNNQTGTATGSQTQPYPSISDALSAAQDGDTIHIAQGIYAGNIMIEERTLTLLGGYVGAPPSDYDNGQAGQFSERAPQANSTVLMGNGRDSVVTLLESSSTLDGLIIRGGTSSTIDLPWALNGGGIFISGGTPTINGNTIEMNDSYHPDHPDIFDVHGGGIYASDSSAKITGNIIRNNVSGRGGGIAIQGGSNVLIQDNQVLDNQGLDDHGGGLYLAAELISVLDNWIAGNEVGVELGYGWGGGVILFGAASRGVFNGNVVTDNFAHSIGSGVFFDDGAVATMQNELVYANRSSECFGQVYVDGLETSPGIYDRSMLTMINCTIADGCGIGIRVEQASTVEARNSIIWGQPGEPFSADETSGYSADYCLSQPEQAGTGNLSSDPLFSSVAGDYHLQSTAGRWDPATNSWVNDPNHSPAIDAGDPQDSYQREPQPAGNRVNLGTYGNTAQASRSGSAAPPPGDVSDRVIAHITRQEGGFKTQIMIDNPNDSPRSYRLWPYTESGQPLASIEGTVPSHSIVTIDALDPLSHLFVDPQSQVTVYATYQAILGSSSPAHLNESPSKSTRWRFYPGDWSVIFDGIAVVNRGDSAADIHIHHYASNGERLATAVAMSQLGPLAKGLYVIGAPTSSTFSRIDSSYFELTSLQPFNLIALRGTPPGSAVNLLWANPVTPLDD